MAYTLQMLEVLQTAIATGATEVYYGDKRVTYRSLDEMIRLERKIMFALGLISPDYGNKFAEFDKGFESSCDTGYRSQSLISAASLLPTSTPINVVMPEGETSTVISDSRMSNRPVSFIIHNDIPNTDFFGKPLESSDLSLTGGNVFRNGDRVIVFYL